MRVKILVAKRLNAFLVFLDDGKHPAALCEFFGYEKANAACAEYRVRKSLVILEGYTLLEACRVITRNKLPPAS
jgi:hypothetical protein